MNGNGMSGNPSQKVPAVTTGHAIILNNYEGLQLLTCDVSHLCDGRKKLSVNFKSGSINFVKKQRL